MATLALLGVAASTRPGRIGVWVDQSVGRSGEAKIAAIGVKVRRWVSFHGSEASMSRPIWSISAALCPVEFTSMA